MEQSFHPTDGLLYGGAPKVGVCEVPKMIIRIFWGVYWGAPIYGNYHSLSLPITRAKKSLNFIIETQKGSPKS